MWRLTEPGEWGRIEPLFPKRWCNQALLCRCGYIRGAELAPEASASERAYLRDVVLHAGSSE